MHDKRGEHISVNATENTDGVPDGWWVGEHGDVAFSKEGTRLFFGTAPRPEPEAEDDRLDEEKVRVDIYDTRGALVRSVTDERQAAGRYHVNWDGRNASNLRVASGVYFVRFTAGEHRAIRKVVLLR